MCSNVHAPFLVHLVDVTKREIMVERKVRVGEKRERQMRVNEEVQDSNDLFLATKIQG